jgi:hypothetical protein
MTTATLDQSTASANLAQAILHRDGTLERAARGEAVTPQHLRAAEQAVRDAETDSRLADAIGQHSRAQREKARIAQLVADTEQMARRMAELVAEDLEAARELDRAVAAAREAAARKRATAEALADQDRMAHDHNNHALEAEAQTNAILAAMPKPEWPKAVTIAAQRIGCGEPLRVEIVQSRVGYRTEHNGRHDHVVLQSAETMARSWYGRFAPPA